MLASKLLRPAKGQGRLARTVDGAMDRLRNSYHASLEFLLGKPVATWATGALVVVLAIAAFGVFTYLPSELVPEEDRGRVDISISGPEGAGYDYTYDAVKQIEARLMEMYEAGEVSRYLVSMPRFGGQQYNTGNGNVTVPEGGVDSNELAAQLNKELAEFTGVRAIAFVRPALRGSEGNSVDLIAIGAEYDQIADWLRPIQAAAEQNPGLARVRMDYEPTSPRLLVTIDREKAAALGVTTQAVGRAMETMFGSRRVTTYIREGREYDVILQTGREERMSQEDLNNLYVRSESGETIPLASVVTSEVRGDTPDRERTDRSRSIDLSAQLNPGYTIGDAIAFFEAEVAKQPGGVGVIWGGGARDYLEAGGAVGLAFGLALLLVFLVLAAQFESWIHPGVIMLTVPVAALGGLFGLLVAGSTINTYSQIGLIILVGIAAKNGILIVEFANQLRDEGLSIREAVIEASTLRLRPIIMTSISAAAGAIPLIVWGGAGGESRRSIGVVIFFGAIFATMLTLFIVPVFYNLLARFTKSPDHMARRIEAFEEAEQARVANAAE
jgi:multidrug efflux pump